MAARKTEDGRRASIRMLLDEAVAYLTDPAEVNRTTFVEFTFVSGKTVQARHVDYAPTAEIVRLVIGMQNGRRDRMAFHIDEISSIRLVDDGRFAFVEPSDKDVLLERYASKIVDAGQCTLLDDSVVLRKLTSTREGMAAFQEAVELSGRDEMIDEFSALLERSGSTVGDLSEISRKQIRRSFALAAVRRGLETAYRPFISEPEWMAAGRLGCVQGR